MNSNIWFLNQDLIYLILLKNVKCYFFKFYLDAFNKNVKIHIYDNLWQNNTYDLIVIYLLRFKALLGI